MKKAIALFAGAILVAQTASAAYLTWQVWVENNAESFEASQYTAHLVAARSQTWDGFHRGQDSENHENQWFETVGSTTVAETDVGRTGVFSDAVTANLANYSSGYYFFIELWADNHVAYVNDTTGTSYADLSSKLVGSMSVPTAGGTAFQMTTATSVPEPATAGLLLIGLGLAGLRRKVRR